MSIEITSCKLKSIELEIKEDGESKLSGKFHLMSKDGKVIATQEFNGYNGRKVQFEQRLIKDFISDIEQRINIDIGIEETVKTIKKG